MPFFCCPVIFFLDLIVEVPQARDAAKSPLSRLPRLGPGAGAKGGESTSAALGRHGPDGTLRPKGVN